jgi:hypothetical protein
MDESRDICLAAILARGLIRVRRRAERAGTWKKPDDQTQPTVDDVTTGDDKPAEDAAGNNSGEQA